MMTTQERINALDPIRRVAAMRAIDALLDMIEALSTPPPPAELSPSPPELESVPAH
jgi:hypothetical protein